MTKPLTLLLYEKILPGGQLVNRLQDLGYRVQAVSDPGALVTLAEQEKPLLVMADLEPRTALVCQAIASLRENTATHHIPIIAIAPASDVPAQDSARQAGATLVVNDVTILQHLSQFLDQALHLE